VIPVSAQALYKWVMAVYKYDEILRKLAPKRKILQELQKNLEDYNGGKTFTKYILKEYQKVGLFNNILTFG